MSFDIKKAEPTDSRIIVSVVGPQASGKTTSALLLASGITDVTGGKILVIDTENNRALTYADNFDFNHLPFDPPFSPQRYLEAIQFTNESGYGKGDVIVIDSMSHEHEGPGGVLEMAEAFLQKRAGDDWKKRERLKMTAWIEPKQARVKTIQQGIQRNECHIILCFRAKDKTVPKKVNGKMEMINMGVQPIGGAEYFYESNITFILPEGSQGAPDWSQPAARINQYGAGGMKDKLHSTSQISAETGRLIAESSVISTQTRKEAEFITEKEVSILVNMVSDTGSDPQDFLDWLGVGGYKQILRKDLKKATDALNRKMESNNETRRAI